MIATESDFQLHERVKQTNRKSLPTRVLSRSMLEHLQDDSICNALEFTVENTKWFRGLSSAQVVEFSSMLIANFAVLLEPKFDMKSTVDNRVKMEPNEFINGLTHSYVHEWVNYCANYRSTYDAIERGVSYEFLFKITKATSVQLEDIISGLIRQDFLTITVNSDCCQQVLREAKAIFKTPYF